MHGKLTIEGAAKRASPFRPWRGGKLGAASLPKIRSAQGLSTRKVVATPLHAEPTSHSTAMALVKADADYTLKPASSAPAIDTSEWPLLLKNWSDCA